MSSWTLLKRSDAKPLYPHAPRQTKVKRLALFRVRGSTQFGGITNPLAELEHFTGAIAPVQQQVTRQFSCVDQVRSQWRATNHLTPFRITILKRRYDADPNPLYPWDVYKLCRAHSLDLPEWVMEYLDRVAHEITAIDPNAKRIDWLVRTALEIKGNPFKRHKDITTKIEVAKRVVELMEKDGKKNGDKQKTDPYFLQVSKELNVSKTTIRRWFKTWA